jgi:hypothetical protein
MNRYSTDMALHPVTIVGQHTELTDVGAVPGRFLVTHGGQAAGPEIATSAGGYGLRPVQRLGWPPDFFIGSVGIWNRAMVTAAAIIQMMLAKASHQPSAVSIEH